MGQQLAELLATAAANKRRRCSCEACLSERLLLTASCCFSEIIPVTVA